MGEKNFKEEKQIFIKDDVEAWITADIVCRSKTDVICRTNNGEERTIKLKEYRRAELPYVNSEMVADLVDIKYLHEPGVLANLISRHEEGKPYTRARDVVISLNPFRWLHHLYSETNQQTYAEKLIWQILDRDPRQDLEPHIYEVSALAYVEMAYKGKNQSIIITGESGSGKTEAVKLMMHHLARIQLGPSQKYPTLQQSHPANQSFSNVVDRILNTNPLLESFGNAKTAQNENSSRFGKYVQLQFDCTATTGQSTTQGKQFASLVGSFCDVYLLETSRVCTHAPHERTYHIFYQLLAASDAKKELIWTGIVGKTAGDFKYIGTPITNVIDGTTDETRFSETHLAFARIGIPENSFRMLMQALCIVLQLGNVELIIADDRVEVATQSEFSSLSYLLGISTEQLLPAFTQRTMTTRNETFKVPLSLSSALEARDALAKYVYLNSFLWLVDTINTKTINLVGNQTHAREGIIGLLDIFGFESFATNRFEQLCINYANEKLQHKALSDIFCTVREEYEFEGLSLGIVEVDSNEQLLRLFDGRSGLIAILNEESYLPKGSSKAFTAKVIENFKSSPLIKSPKVGIYNCFGIDHFAGTVMYTTDNFLISNQDTLPLDLKECVSKSQNHIATGSQKLLSSVHVDAESTSVKTSTHATLPSMLPSSHSSKMKPLNMSIGRKWELTLEKCKDKLKLKPSQQTYMNSKNIDSRSPNPWKDLQMNTSKRNISSHQRLKLYDRQSSSSNLISATVWTKYRAQLNSLMQTLQETHSRYVRCIKPNTRMSPEKCDRIMVSRQLHYTGLVPTIALSRALYTKSETNKNIIVKFRFMWDVKNYPSKAKRLDTNEARRKLDCEALLLSIMTSRGFVCTQPDLKDCQYTVGRTRSYFRQGVLEWLESTRIIELSKFATKIQRHVRGYLTRKEQATLWKAASAIQSWFRTLVKECASSVIQRHYRSYKQRKYIIERKKSAMTIQRHYRSYKQRKCIIERKKSATMIQTYYHGYKQRKCIIVRKISATKIQRYFCGYKQRKYIIEREKSAMTIQRYYRGYKQRTYIIER